MASAVTSSRFVKWRRPCLLLTLQLRSQTLCKLLDADHDDPRNDFFDDVKKTEISVSADGDFGEMKKTETPSKRRIVGRHDSCMSISHIIPPMVNRFMFVTQIISNKHRNEVLAKPAAGFKLMDFSATSHAFSLRQIINTYYRPPNETSDSLDTLQRALDEINDLTKNNHKSTIVVAGDFNARDIDCDSLTKSAERKDFVINLYLS